ncbi:ABC transporter permease [Nocardioides sp. dk4132]|uniref:ABC transporter permease n=1 Tax=unclassified Nocardioides TaxID=2615069 RepID=UPI001296FFB3|nr:MULTISPECIES: ABC transporter permease [unclassified Nocardioides]MQW75934.1 ABC transporter permease [Nocardioides sp. dk4132]QGA08795.1 ABC transporter permease [Nocardioides sp. dk884]
MSTTAPAPASPEGTVSDDLAVITVVSKKTPIILAVLTLALGAMALFGSQSGDTTFRLSTRNDFFELPDITVPAMTATWVAVVLLALLTAESARRYLSRRTTPIWMVVVFAAVTMTGFLTWAGAGSTIPVVGLIAGSIALAVPLIFGALGGVLGERAGVVNIAIDGQLLAGAFAAATVASVAGSAWAGVIGAMGAGALVALVLGIFAISYHVEQVIVGVVLNVLIIGFTSFMFGQVLVPNSEALNSPPRLGPLAIPLLGDIPLIGPVLFRQSPIVYLLYITVAVVAWALYRTKWGLRVRAVGEHPKAADTVGINVIATRYKTVLLAGAIAGMGGAFYTLVSVQQFNRDMTSGAGYIALAAVIFGKWDPIRATLAALLFGFATNLQGVLSVIGSPVPSEFMLMLPYVVTVVAVAGLVGKSRGPAAVGLPYKKA